MPNFDEIIDVDVAENEPARQNTLPPTFRVYEGSRIAVSSQVGKRFQRMKEAATFAYTHVNEVWETVFRYYNNDQSKTNATPIGTFKRGDSSENIVFSNLNILLPAIYSKDPDITCTTTDEQDEPFCRALQALVNALFRRKDGLNAKSKIKKGAGIGLLTNFGILKLNFTKKDDSREIAIEQMQQMTNALAAAKTQEEVDRIYGELEALEQNMEVYIPSGFGMGNVLPHNLIVDPYAEQPDGLDGNWMMERVFLPTNAITAMYTQPAQDDDGSAEAERVLVYRPTHKAAFAGTSSQDGGLGLVLEEIDRGGSIPTSYTDDERTAYINMYYSECYYVWDRPTRRLLLFHRDDWTWPLWVWDDPLKITRFFPYFIISFAMSTGGTVSVGETAYTLDQQDELNDINKQKARIRRSVFDFFFYDSDNVDPEEAEKFIKALRGEGGVDGSHLLGVRAGGKNISELISSFAPPALKFEQLFDKSSTLDAVNRIQNISDAIRGVQFKTNTNVEAVNTYQESLRLSVGAKVDVIEDVVADIAIAIAEIAIQNYDEEEVAGFVGSALAAGWTQMSVDDFRSTYSLDIVSGSMEKPNSVFKKKEAIEIVQAVGQFATAAPGAALRIMLKLLQGAFTEVNIKPEDWAALDQEVAANLQRGNSTGSGAPNGGGDASGQPSDIMEKAKALPDAVKQQVVQMHQQGMPEQQIAAFIVQQVKGLSNGSGQKPARA